MGFKENWMESDAKWIKMNLLVFIISAFEKRGSVQIDDLCTQLCVTNSIHN